MKRVYERPVMMAEVYETMAYCNGCGTSFKNGTITTIAALANSTNNGNGNWSPGNSGFDESDLVHTFDNTSIYETKNGLCGWGSNCENKSQSIWKCTCHPGDPWYLEWSHYYTVHQNNGKDTFFLYHEENENNSFDITPNSTSWPAIENGTDYNVAQIVYNENESIVANS